MNITSLMFYAQYLEEDKNKDRGEHLSKKAKSAGTELSQPKQSKGDKSFTYIRDLGVMHHI